MNDLQIQFMKNCFDGECKEDQSKDSLLTKMRFIVKIIFSSNVDEMITLHDKILNQGKEIFEVIAEIIDKLYDQQNCSWYFIVCLMAIIDMELFWSYKTMQFQIASVCDVFSSSISCWITDNGGWKEFRENFDFDDLYFCELVVSAVNELFD